ncbi:MAG: UDP-N-acetyl-2-amino-2-deoxyglucuronate dehydrogenase [Granulosicoccus sp.]|jgi:UDP-N-acetyl-2-amino-2-deoxyglucuronate dehydrogenase
MNNKVTRLAVIGLGMASKPHLAALRQLAPAIEVAGVYTRNAERCASVAEQIKCKVYNSIAAICSDPSVDGAIIITPPNARMEIVRSLAAVGKHVLMEKPVERNLVNANAIVKICEEAGVSLGIVLQHRFRAGAIALSDLVQSGKLGQIHLVRVVLPWWRDQSYYDQPGRGTYEVDGGGVLITQAIHVMDLMLSLTGAVSEVSAMMGQTPLHDMEAEDFANASLRFENGAMGSITATTANYPGGAETLEIDTDHAALRLTAGELVVAWRDGRTETFGEITGTGGGSDPMDFPCDWHSDLIADFATSLKNETPPMITGRDALEVHKLIDAIERSAKTGNQVTLEKNP